MWYRLYINKFYSEVLKIRILWVYNIILFGEWSWVCCKSEFVLSVFVIIVFYSSMFKWGLS